MLECRPTRIRTQAVEKRIIGKHHEADVALDAPVRQIDARTVINAHVGYTPNGARWTLGLWVRNLADEDYMLSRNQDLFGNQFVKHGDPRIFGADLAYQF